MWMGCLYAGYKMFAEGSDGEWLLCMGLFFLFMVIGMFANMSYDDKMNKDNPDWITWPRALGIYFLFRIVLWPFTRK